jgi:glucose/arabinose dehydrogenase
VVPGLACVVGTGFLGVGFFLAAGPAAAALPNGFADQAVATGLAQPSSLDFLPDGRVLITEQVTGNVRLVVDTTLVASPLLTLTDVNTSGGERGLLGIAVDAGWPTRPYVYLFFTRSPGNVSYISRYTASGDLSDPVSANLSLSDRYNLLVDIPDVYNNHNAGTLRFGPDGMLYASVGEDGVACAAQDSSDLRGVMLRMDVSGLPAGPGTADKSQLCPPDNPFPSADPNVALTFCYGHRNPFRFHVDPVTGRLYIGDVGQRDYEEVDEAVGGENFGWPFREGPLVRTQPGCTEPGGAGASTYDSPIGGYDRSAFPSSAIIGGPRYRTVPEGAYTFPPLYEGAVFFSEYYQGFVRVIRETGGVWAPLDSVPGQPNGNDWATGVNYVGDYLEGPDGAIYYLKQSTGTLRRIVYVNAVTSAPAPPALSGRLLAVRPNPYRPGNGTLAVDAAVPLPATELAVYSLTGRRIRTLARTADGESWVWDGRDASGRRVPAGVYFVAAPGGRPLAAARVVVLE